MSGRFEPRAGTIVIRNGAIVYASEGAARIAGRRVEDGIGRPYSTFIVAEERSVLEDRHQRRVRGEAVPDRYEVNLLLPDGNCRTVEIHVEQDGADALIHMRDLSAQQARRLRLDSVATLGAAIQHERTEEGISCRVREELRQLGVASAFLGQERDGVRIVWASVPEPFSSGFLTAAGAPFEGFVLPWNDFLRRLRSEGAAFADDLALELSRAMPETLATEVRRLVGAGEMGRAAAVRVEHRGDAQTCLLMAGDWLTPDDLPAVRLFGAQLAAALDAARTISDLSGRNADLGTLNRIAELAGDSPDLETFFARAAEVLRYSLDSRGIDVYVLDEPGTQLVRVYEHGAAGDAVHGQERVPLDGLRGDAVRQRSVKVTEVVSRDAAAGIAQPGFRTTVWVPLVIRSRSIGVLSASFDLPEERVRERLDLLTAVTAHFASAVESQTLLRRLRRRLSDLEGVNALAERVFANAPGDMPALLRDGCRESARALSCEAAVLFLVDDGGGTLRAAAAWGMELDPQDMVRLRLEDDALPAAAMRRRAPVSAQDIKHEPHDSTAERGSPFAAAGLAVPLTSRDALRGVLYLAGAAGRTFSEADVALASALAGELAVGLENTDLYADLRRRVEELSLLHDVGRSLVATLDIKHVLERGVHNLARIVDAPHASLALASDDEKYIEVCAVAGGHVSHIGLRLPLGEPESSLGALVFRKREPIVVEDARSDARVNALLRDEVDGRAYLGLPLVVRDRTIGVAVIIDPRGPRRFTSAEVERAAAIANQLAVAVENARLYEDLRRSYADLARAQQQLIQGERLAALGELSAVVAHEVRNPLGVIFNSLGSLRRLLRPSGDAKMLLDIVGEEADRLNRIVGDLLDFARPSTPQLRPEPLERVVEEAVRAALAQRPSAIELDRRFDAAAPLVPLDARLVRQAVLNVAVNAVQAMPRGGRISIRTCHDADGALVEIEDTGPGIPDEVKARIFEPFFTTKASGTGLGLAVVKRIVEGHGGSVTVRSGPASGTVFGLHFPPGADGAVEKATAMR